MKTYSVDLERKIVKAVSTGTPKARAARSSGISLSTVKRYVDRTRRRSRKRKAGGSNPGPDLGYSRALA